MQIGANHGRAREKSMAPWQIPMATTMCVYCRLYTTVLYQITCTCGLGISGLSELNPMTYRRPLKGRSICRQNAGGASLRLLCNTLLTTVHMGMQILYSKKIHLVSSVVSFALLRAFEKVGLALNCCIGSLQPQRGGNKMIICCFEESTHLH